MCLGWSCKSTQKELPITDFRSLEELEVYKEDHLVAHLRRLPRGCEFQYTNEFLTSSESAIALHLPKLKEGQKVEGLANLPTYFAGLLPEGIMFNAVKNLIGSAADDLFAILAATGADAIGDIEVRVPGRIQRKSHLNFDDAADLIESLLKGKRGTSLDYLAAIPGVQPKLSIGEIVRAGRKTTYIVKYETPEFPRLLENEYVLMRLAKRCRLNVAPVRLREGTFVIDRFDRRFDPVLKNLERFHVEDMCQVMDLFPNSKYSMDYLDLMQAMARLGVGKATLLDALRLYVFSYIIGNGDLHAKNVSLILDKSDGQWRLSPAYDLLSTLPYSETLTGSDRMALPLAEESFGRFTREEFLQFGLRFDLPERAVSRMLGNLSSGVLKNLDDIHGEFLPAEVIDVIKLRARALSGS